MRRPRDDHGTNESIQTQPELELEADLGDGG